MDEKFDIYKKILTRNYQNFLDPAIQTINTCHQKELSNLYNTTAMVAAPVLISFVLWVIQRAESQGIKCLFFLSRDGYIYYKIAKLLVKALDIQICCHYFCCSRYSLRKAMLFVDYEYAIEKLCQSGGNVSYSTILKRIGLSETNAPLIINKENENINRNLSNFELMQLKKRMFDNEELKSMLIRLGLKEYKVFIEYCRQEFLKNNPIAIVDSGWVGSMQESLGKILKFDGGFNEYIVGFYFGLYYEINPKFGTGQAYYFSANKSKFNRLFFNNNLFEILCSAPHGMTISYQSNNNRIIPIFKSYKKNLLITNQIKIYLIYLKFYIEYNDQLFIDNYTNLYMVRSLLNKLMNNPSVSEAALYNQFTFSDDPSENMKINLCPVLTQNELSENLLFKKIINKIFRKAKGRININTYWQQGSFVLSNANKLQKFSYLLLRILQMLKQYPL